MSLTDTQRLFAQDAARSLPGYKSFFEQGQVTEEDVFNDIQETLKSPNKTRLLADMFENMPNYSKFQSQVDLKMIEEDINSLATPEPLRNLDTSKLGFVSEQEESNGKVDAISKAEKTGNVNYGPWQIASKPGTMDNYIKFSSKYGARLNTSRPGSTAFANTWREIATEDPDGFKADQFEFIKKSHYDPVKNVLEEKLGSIEGVPSLKELAFSIGVQYGNLGKRVVSDAIESLGTGEVTEKDVVDAIMQRRISGIDRDFRSQSEDMKEYLRSTRFVREWETVNSLIGKTDSPPQSDNLEQEFAQQQSERGVDKPLNLFEATVGRAGSGIADMAANFVRANAISATPLGKMIMSAQGKDVDPAAMNKARVDLDKKIDGALDKLVTPEFRARLDKVREGDKFSTDIPRTIQSIVGWTLDTAPYFVASMGGPYGIALIMGSTMGSISKELIDAGIDPSIADKYAIIGGAISGTVEYAQQAANKVIGKIPPLRKAMDKIGDAAAKKIFSKAVIGKLANNKIVQRAFKLADVPIEGFEEVVQGGVENVFLRAAAKEQGWTDKEIDERIGKYTAKEARQQFEAGVGAAIGLRGAQVGGRAAIRAAQKVGTKADVSDPNVVPAPRTDVDAPVTIAGDTEFGGYDNIQEFDKAVKEMQAAGANTETILNTLSDIEKAEYTKFNETSEISVPTETPVETIAAVEPTDTPLKTQKEIVTGEQDVSLVPKPTSKQINDFWNNLSQEDKKLYRDGMKDLGIKLQNAETLTDLINNNIININTNTGEITVDDNKKVNLKPEQIATTEEVAQEAPVAEVTPVADQVVPEEVAKPAPDEQKPAKKLVKRVTPTVSTPEAQKAVEKPVKVVAKKTADAPVADDSKPSPAVAKTEVKQKKSVRVTVDEEGNVIRRGDETVKTDEEPTVKPRKQITDLNEARMWLYKQKRYPVKLLQNMPDAEVQDLIDIRNTEGEKAVDRFNQKEYNKTAKESVRVNTNRDVLKPFVDKLYNEVELPYDKADKAQQKLIDDGVIVVRKSRSGNMVVSSNIVTKTNPDTGKKITVDRLSEVKEKWEHSVRPVKESGKSFSNEVVGTTGKPKRDYNPDDWDVYQGTTDLDIDEYAPNYSVDEDADYTEPRYSRDTKASGEQMSPKDRGRLLKQMMDSAKEFGFDTKGIHVAFGNKERPVSIKNVLQRFRKDEAGSYEADGKGNAFIFINDKMGKKEIVDTFFHELFGHGGSDVAFALDKDIESLGKKLFDADKSDTKAAVMQEYAARDHFSEWFAYHAEKIRKDFFDDDGKIVPANVRNADNSLKKLFNTIREFVRNKINKILGRDNVVSQDQINDYTRGVLEYVSKRMREPDPTDPKKSDRKDSKKTAEKLVENYKKDQEAKEKKALEDVVKKASEKPKPTTLERNVNALNKVKKLAREAKLSIESIEEITDVNKFKTELLRYINNNVRRKSSLRESFYRYVEKIQSTRNDKHRVAILNALKKVKIEHDRRNAIAHLKSLTRFVPKKANAEVKREAAFFKRSKYADFKDTKTTQELYEQADSFRKKVFEERERLAAQREEVIARKQKGIETLTKAVESFKESRKKFSFRKAVSPLIDNRLAEALTDIRTITYELDGGVDNGPVFQLVYKAMDDAETKRTTFLREVFNTLNDDLKDIPIDRMSNARVSGYYRHGKEAAKRVGRALGLNIESKVKYNDLEFTYTDKDGNKVKDKVKLSDAELVTLALTALDPQGFMHLANNKFAISRDGLLEYHRLGLDDIVRIVDMVETDKNMKVVADSVRKHFKKTTPKYLNEASQKLAGYDVAIEGDMFPITVVSEMLEKELKTGQEMKVTDFVKSMQPMGTPGSVAITKMRQKGATSPILIMDVFESVARHQSLAEKYVGYAEMYRDLTNVFNSVEVQSLKNSDKTIKFKIDALESVLEEYNQRAPTSKIASSLYNMSTVGVLGWRVKTVATQMAGVFPTLASMGEKGLMASYIKNFAAHPFNVLQANSEMVAHSPQLWERFELNMVNREFAELHRTAEARRLFNFDDRKSHMEKILSAKTGMAFVSAPDMFMVGAAWNTFKEDAVKKGYKEGSDEYWNYIARNTESLVFQTQPSASLKDRSKIFLSEHAWLKPLTWFGSASNKNANFMKRALIDIGNGKVGKGLSAFMLVSVAQSLYMVAARRLLANATKGVLGLFKDDEDEEELIKNLIIDTAFENVEQIIGGRQLVLIAEAIKDKKRPQSSGYLPIDIAIETAEAGIAIRKAFEPKTWKDYRYDSDTNAKEKKALKAIAKLAKRAGISAGNIEDSFTTLMNIITGKLE